MRDIVGYEGLYAVTSCGKVWSYRRNKFLAPGKTHSGYLVVCLRKNGRGKMFSVHRLVAQAYIENPLGLDTVDHIDGCKTHNNVQNLQWLSNADNVKKANNKTVYQFNLAGNLIKVFPSCHEAERETGVKFRNISKCATGKTKTAGGYIWRYESEVSEQ